MSKATSSNNKGADQLNRSISENPTEQRSASNFQSFLSFVDKYILEWLDLSTVCEDADLTHLREIAISGHLKVSKFRSVCWAVFLNVLEGNPSTWMETRRKQRKKYQETKAKHSANPRNDHPSNSSSISPPIVGLDDDPLSQSEKSVWNQHFCDQELYGVIRQDVVRTFPGVDFYRRPAVQELMVNVLFCYARENPTMCYRQGMHEILAPILFVMHCDQQTFMHIQDVCGDEDVDLTLLAEILDHNYMEEDSYYIFSKIMNAIESFYRINDMTPSATGYFPPSNGVQVHAGDEQRSKLEVVGQLNSIRDKILAVVDPQLHCHLLKMDIPLTLFGIRWLRLLFGREFSLPDLLVLWDSIFAAGINFELTNYIVVSMLMQIRTTLLSSDYMNCLTHLMKYPSNVDVTHVIRFALHIKMPTIYECPPGTHLQTLSTKLNPRTVQNRKTNDEILHRRAVSNDENKNNSQRIRSDSLIQKDRNVHMRSIQNTSAMATMRIDPSAPGEHDPSIVEGFREDSPELLRIELESAHSIMAITRLKLSQYLTVLRQNIPGNPMDAVHQSLDGIEELCALLQVKSDSGFRQALPVERAFEVNEPPLVDNPTTASNSSNLNPLFTVPATSFTSAPPIGRRIYRRSEGEETRRSFVQQLQRADDNDFEIVVSEAGIVDTLTYGELVFTSTVIEPAQEIDDRGAMGARYEIPDDGRHMSRMTKKILGDRKEVEMHEFNPKIGFPEVEPLKLLGIGNTPIVDPSYERNSPDN